jgi:hypothetical protein
MMRRILISLGMAVGLLGIGSELHAADIVTPGTACEYYGTQSGDTFFSPSGLGANAIRNTGATAQFVTCPLPKTFGTKIKGAWIVLDDNQGNCLLYKRNTDGSGIASQTTTPIAAANGQWLYKWDFGAAGWTGTEQATVSIYCSVRASRVVSAYYLHD